MISTILIAAFLLSLTVQLQILTPKDSIKDILNGLYTSNNLNLPLGILSCFDDIQSSRIRVFLQKTINNGKNGNINQLISIIDDLHTFYQQTRIQIIECMIKNQDQILEINYQFGIGYLPLAKQRYIDQVTNNFIKMHQRFQQLYNLISLQDYQNLGKMISQYGHQIYPFNKKIIRGTWITNVASKALDSKDNIQQAIIQCKKAGFNTIFVVVYNNARTIYPSKVMENLIGIKQQQKFAGRDPLAQIIEMAKQYQIEVHAWFEYGFSSSYNASGGIIIEKKPHWKAIDSKGNLVVKNGFDWLNGFDPQVQQYMISLFKEVINNYNVDGVQGDDRLPALPSISGYQPYTVQLYKKQHNNQMPPQDYINEDWINWRVGKLNDFMKLLRNQVKSLKSTIYLSVSPSPYPWSKYQYLQDWPTWVKYNWVDAVIPQCYRYDINAYTSVLNQQITYFKNKKIVFAPGILLNIGSYTANTTYLQQMINLNRKNILHGEVFFYYQGIVNQKLWFETIYKTSVQPILELKPSHYQIQSSSQDDDYKSNQNLHNNIGRQRQQ